MFGVGLMFGVGPVPVDDVVVSCEPAFVFEAVDGSTVPPPLEPITRMNGGICHFQYEAIDLLP